LFRCERAEGRRHSWFLHEGRVVKYVAELKARLRRHGRGYELFPVFHQVLRPGSHSATAHEHDRLATAVPGLSCRVRLTSCVWYSAITAGLYWCTGSGGLPDAG